MTWNDLCTDLLPPQASLHLGTLVMTEGGMRLDVAATALQALCPNRLDLGPTFFDRGEVRRIRRSDRSIAHASTAVASTNRTLDA